MEANLENIRRIYADLSVQFLHPGAYLSFSGSHVENIPINVVNLTKAQNHEGSTIDSFHRMSLTFKEFFTKGINIIYWFPASAQVPRSLWQPHPAAHFPPAGECMFSYSVPTTLGPHHVPVILPTLWHVFLHPPLLPHPLPCWLVRIHACGLSAVVCRHSKWCHCCWHFITQQGACLHGGRFCAHVCSSMPPLDPPARARMSVWIGPLGTYHRMWFDFICLDSYDRRSFETHNSFFQSYG